MKYFLAVQKRTTTTAAAAAAAATTTKMCIRDRFTVTNYYILSQLLFIPNSLNNTPNNKILQLYKVSLFIHSVNMK